jgi:hypothetical protein
MVHRRLVASARSPTARSRKSATGTRVNETVIRKGIVIVTVTATATGKRKETEIMTENENENATAIVTVTVIGNVIATRTETVVPGTTAGTKMVDRATMVVTANGTGKATRHETVVTEIEIDTRYGDQILDGMRRNDAQGRRKIVEAAMTNLERSGARKRGAKRESACGFLK